MKSNLNGALIVLAVIFFFVGRFTAPKEMDDQRHTIDSLKRDIRIREEREMMSLDSMNHYRILSDTWFSIAQNQKEKLIIKTIYNNEVRKVNSLTLSQLDSALRAEYPDH